MLFRETVIVSCEKHKKKRKRHVPVVEKVQRFIVVKHVVCALSTAL